MTVRWMTICWMFWIIPALGLCGGFKVAAAHAGALSYRLTMLGYSEADIGAIVKGEKRRTEVDRAQRLKLLGYGSNEIAAFLSASAGAALQRQRRSDRHLLYQPLVQRLAKQNGVDPCLVMAVIRAESNFNARAVSPAKAAGLMQLMPGTAAELGVRDRFDPVQNISAGTRYLAQCLNRFGDVRLALAAYNTGPNRVERLKGFPNNPQTRQFVQRVLAYHREFVAAAK